MRRLNQLFLAVVLVAAAVGGATALQLREDLDVLTTASVLEDRVEVVVAGGVLTDRGFEVAARVENPTDHRLRVAGGFVSSHDASGEDLASGATSRLDDGGDVLEPGESLPVRLLLRLSPTEREQLSAGLADGDVSVAVTFTVYYHETGFTVLGQGTVEGGEK